MKISALASGSKGNCFYIENKGTAVLIDAGISSRQISERLLRLNKDEKKIRGIFITHEHSDHIRGADVFARRFNIPVYATKRTAQSSFLCSNPELINEIKNDETISLNGMCIEAFSKPHRAADPVSFNVFNGKKISVITDAGFPCQSIIDNVSDSNFLCIESNHDVSMLEGGPYPHFLKQWIKSDIGHLSNTQAGLCVMEHARKKIKRIILSHLSEINNTPDIALKTFNGLIRERMDLRPEVSVSGRTPTEVFSI
jgi:phosphoribosyl 1,2-cyclic phosphodiesterase